MRECVTKILLTFIFIILLLPLANDKLHLISSGGLYGSFSQSQDVEFTTEKWLTGEFQEGKSKYLNDNISFRPDLVRLNAQLTYSLFRQHTTGWGVIGKNNCLLDINYIRSYTGADYIGYDSIYTRMVKLKALQDTLERMGKLLVMVHAPNKAFYYSDDIPDRYFEGRRPPTTNYATYLRLGDSLGVNQLDFNLWFCKMKDTSRELLYPKQGIHWSMYGGILAADSMVKYIEDRIGATIPHMRVRSTVRTNQPRETDDDMGKVMNLFWPVTNETFTYVQCDCDSSRAMKRPAGVYIGDSFTSMMRDNWIFDCVNSSWEIWYYMQERQYRVPTQHAQIQIPMGNYDWLAALDKTDYIVLMYTANNLGRLGDGFIERAYEHYFSGK